MVELLLLYSNQPIVALSLDKLTSALLTPPKPNAPEHVVWPQQRHRRLTAEQTQALVDRYGSGETAQQLGEAFTINPKTVCVILKREGAVTRHRKLSDDGITSAIKLYESGLSLQAVGDKLGVNARTILNHLRRRSVARRGVGTNQWDGGMRP
jgi:hypothetical protein